MAELTARITIALERDLPPAPLSQLPDSFLKASAIELAIFVRRARHDFAGNLDRNNYPDGYHKLATTYPLPTFEEYDSPTLNGNGDQNVVGEEAQRFAKDMREAREARAGSRALAW